jgi:LysR family glycine cleavage system transcriptional activator
MPRLAAFARRQPDVALSFSASTVHSDFATGQVDLDIRYGLPNWPHLHVQPIFEERIQPLASPAFLARHRIEQPEDLLHVPLIQSAVNVVQWPQWFRSRGVPFTPGRYAYSFDRSAMALDAAVQGLGVACDSASIAAGHVAAGRLRKLFDERWCVKVQAHFIVCPPRHLQRPQVVDFIEWIRQHAAEPEGVAEGAPESTPTASVDLAPHQPASRQSNLE